MRAGAEGATVSPCPDGWLVAFGRRARDNRGTQVSVRCEHAIEADQMSPRTWHECGESLHELQGFHYDMGGAIEVKGF